MTALGPGELTRRQAEREMMKILDRVPDSQLPKPRIEHRDGEVIAWWGGKGFHIEPRTMRDGADRRRFDLAEAFECEWIRRERQRRYGKGYEFRDGEQVGGKPTERAS